MSPNWGDAARHFKFEGMHLLKIPRFLEHNQPLANGTARHGDDPRPIIEIADVGGICVICGRKGRTYQGFPVPFPRLDYGHHSPGQDADKGQQIQTPATVTRRRNMKVRVLGSSAGVVRVHYLSNLCDSGPRKTQWEYCN